MEKTARPPARYDWRIARIPVYHVKKTAPMKFNFKLAKGDRNKVSITESAMTEIVLVGGRKEIRLGAGLKKEVTRRKLIRLARQVVMAGKRAKAKKLEIDFKEFDFPQLNIGPEELAELLAVNFVMANFEFVKYKTPPKEGWGFIEEVAIANAHSKQIKSGFEKGRIIGEGINVSRELSNTPGGEMTPEILAHDIVKAAKGTGARVKILGRNEIRKLGMGGILGVASGSAHEPKFIIVEYRGAGKSQKPVVLVGKGITFDTGGLNIKPGNHMNEMHLDMTGGAAVAMAAIIAARLKIRRNVVALIPAAENALSGSSYRPGDVLRTMSGKTIEVLNTDAEGRVILSDALTYAERYKPECVIDVATLTGAALVALGTRASAIFSREDILTEELIRLGEETGDLLWRLPLWEEYEADIKGTFGDWANVEKGRYGGAIAGAIFLYQFAKNYRWAHLDIAPRMTATEDDVLAKGSSGEPIRLLVRFLEKGQAFQKLI